MGLKQLSVKGGPGGGTTIHVVADFSALPSPGTVTGQFYWCNNELNTHLTGLYYSDGSNWLHSQATEIKIVPNYSGLPSAATHSGEFYWCESSQGTAWLPGSIGGTYYSAGLYYSNGSAWTYLEVPYQATQAQVNTGTNNDMFVTPYTFTNANKWGNYVPYTGATGDVDLGAHVMNAQAFHAKGTAGNGHLGLKHQSADASASASESSLFADSNGDAKWKIDGNYYSTFKTSGNTANRVYTFPDASVTLASTADVYKRTTVGNANYTILASDKEVVTSVAFTTARTWTLPTDAPAGWAIQVLDEYQTITTTNTLTIAVASGKYLNGVLNGTEVIQTAGAGRMLYSDGSGNWALDAGIVRTTKTQTLTNKTLDLTSMIGALNEAQGADIASASTTDIGAATGNSVTVTGTTTITALGTVQAGTRRTVTFSGALTLTYNATSLILPGAANITTVAGDSAVFISLGSGNWKCTSYTRSAELPLYPAAAAALYSSTGRKYFAYDNTTSTYTGSTGDNILKTISIPANSMGANSVLEICANFIKTGTAGNPAYGFYVGTSAVALSGGALIQYVQPGATNLQVGCWARLVNKNSTSTQNTKSISAQAANPQAAQTSAVVSRTFDFTTQLYLHIYATGANSADTQGISDYQVYIDKP